MIRWTSCGLLILAASGLLILAAVHLARVNGTISHSRPYYVGTAATPVPDEQPTPVTEEQPTPVPDEQPTPVTEEQPTPVPDEQPTPVTDEQPTPVTDEQPTPAPEETDYGIKPVVTPGCNSVTEVDGRPACPGQVIFFDDFTTPQKIDKFKWTHEILMPWKPHYGFVIFDDKDQNSYLENGTLYIKPTLSTEDRIKGTYDMGERCTGPTGGGYNDPEECKRTGLNHNILPPVFSARLSTRKSFSFKYGRVDIRAKLPMGDWIVPEIWLETKDRSVYGPQPFKSARIQIAMARGNKKLHCLLTYPYYMGNYLVESGVYLWKRDANPVSKLLKRRMFLVEQNWGDSFHNYSITWTPDQIDFMIDGESLGLIRPTKNHPLYRTLGISETEAKDWKRGNDMAPFDREVYIVLGVNVGGRIPSVFPDRCNSDSGQKPWRNVAAKAVANFWEKKDNWEKTWRGLHYALQVDSIKVTALDSNTSFSKPGNVQVGTAPAPKEEDYRAKPSQAKPGCNSVTEVNSRPACPGQEIFFDDFITPQKIEDKVKWTHEILMPWKPDYGFVMFDDKEQNSYLENGTLYIKPTPSTDYRVRGTYDMGERCTGPTGGGFNDSEECKRTGISHNILPPVFSARLSTRKSFSFKYGRVDVRAKLPTGDWIVPEIWLEPKDRSVYGPQPFKSGRIQIAMARGNKKLNCDGISMGSSLVESGVYLWNGDDDPVSKLLKKKLVDQNWGESFHNYSINWTPDNIDFLVDGESFGLIRSSKNHPLYRTLGISDSVAKDWKQGNDMAPFDREFYIVLGVTVGGRTAAVFPDNCNSDSGQKPWRNVGTKAVANFWEKKDSWKKTWRELHYALQVDSIKVTALDEEQTQKFNLEEELSEIPFSKPAYEIIAFPNYDA